MCNPVLSLSNARGEIVTLVPELGVTRSPVTQYNSISLDGDLCVTGSAGGDPNFHVTLSEAEGSE